MSNFGHILTSYSDMGRSRAAYRFWWGNMKEGRP